LANALSLTNVAVTQGIIKQPSHGHVEDVPSPFAGINTEIEAIECSIYANHFCPTYISQELKTFMSFGNASRQG
jgi:hypothetical protein